MILAGDFKKGSKILYKGEPYTVLDYQHVKPGKGGAFMRTKMRNLISGLVREETFRSEEKLETPDLQYKNMVYLYQDDNLYHFMDQESYEQIALTKDQLEDVIDYLKEQVEYTALYFNDKPIAISAPNHLDLKVTETVPGIRGDTAQGAATKAATLETGLVLQVPLFVEENDLVRIDTRENKYIERVIEKKK